MKAQAETRQSSQTCSGDQHAQLDSEYAEDANPESPDEYRTFNNFWVRPDARWADLQTAARQPEVGEMLDGRYESYRVRPADGKERATQVLRPSRYRQGALRPAHRNGRQGQRCRGLLQ